MRHNLLTKILVLVLALLVLIPNMGLGVFAADEGQNSEDSETYDVSGSKTSSKTILYTNERQTDITLSLPSAEYKHKVDIVFVLDDSTSVHNINSTFVQTALEMFDSIKEKQIDLKIGIITFKGLSTDAISKATDTAFSGLTSVNDLTEEQIQAAFAVTPDGRGSNIDGGLILADSWLSKDEEVEDSNKYLVLMTDCKTYIWGDSENPTTIYAQFVDQNYNICSFKDSANVSIKGYPIVAQNSHSDRYMHPNDGSLFPDEYSMALYAKLDWMSVSVSDTNPSTYLTQYKALYNSTNPELTGNDYDYFCQYAVDGTPNLPGEVITHNVTNPDVMGNTSRKDLRNYYEYLPDESVKNVPHYDSNLYEIIEATDDEGNKTYTFDTQHVNPDFFYFHVAPIEKASYIVGHRWSELSDNYNTALIYPTKEPNGSGVRAPALGLRMFMIEESKYSSLETDAASMLNDIEDDITYLVDSGVVTDVIPDVFTLVDKGDSTFTMTLDGEALPVVHDEDTTWYFGEPKTDDEGNVTYPYVVAFNEETNSFDWFINTKVENAHPVTLTYTLEINEDAKEDIYDTNVSAILNYVTTNDEEGEYEFSIPKVAYIKLIDINVEKVWKDYDDQDGIRPDKITVQLVGGKEPVDGELTEKGQWKFTFRNVPNSTVDDEKNPTKLTKIAYTIVEEGVDGYTSGKPDGSVEKGFTITNTHEPEFSFFIAKIWDDEQDADGIRPESVTVSLLANGEPIDEAELGDFNMWTASYTVPFYDEDGEPIEYTVTEEPVEGYEKPVIVFDPDYSVYLVTNKHEVKEPPKTDDATNQWFWAGMMVSSMALIAVIFFLKRKQDEE